MSRRNSEQSLRIRLAKHLHVSARESRNDSAGQTGPGPSRGPEADSSGGPEADSSAGSKADSSSSSSTNATPSSSRSVAPDVSVPAAPKPTRPQIGPRRISFAPLPSKRDAESSEESAEEDDPESSDEDSPDEGGKVPSPAPDTPVDEVIIFDFSEDSSEEESGKAAEPSRGCKKRGPSDP